MSTTDVMSDGTIGISEAQEFSGLGRTYLYSLMDRGVLPFTKMGARRLIPRRALIALLSEGLTSQRQAGLPAPAPPETPRRRSARQLR